MRNECILRDVKGFSLPERLEQRGFELKGKRKMQGSSLQKFARANGCTRDHFTLKNLLLAGSLITIIITADAAPVVVENIKEYIHALQNSESQWYMEVQPYSQPLIYKE